MLAASRYDQDYLDARRAAVDRRVTAYDALGADDAFGVLFFNALVLELELSFVHRVRNREGKDGNPLNEVRLLSASLLENGAVLGDGKAMKVKPETSVLGLAEGDEIALTRDDFTRLATAFFAEIEKKYG